MVYYKPYLFVVERGIMSDSPEAKVDSNEEIYNSMALKAGRSQAEVDALAATSEQKRVAVEAIQDVSIGLGMIAQKVRGSLEEVLQKELRKR